MMITSPIIIFFARWFAWLVIATAVIFFIFEYKNHIKRIFTEILITASTIFVAWGIAAIIKNITHISRPFVMNGATSNFYVAGNASFPSGHATVFFALATAIYLYNKRVGIFFYLAAVIIAISRVLVGVHYPVDIMVGAVIGIVTALSVNYLFRQKAVK